MKKNILNSPRLLELKRSRRKIFLGKILLSIISIFLVLTCLAYISRISSLNISEIEIIGNKMVDTEKIKAVAQQEIAGNYLWFFPKTNILIYPKNNIKNELSEKFKRLKEIRLAIKDKKILEIGVVERTALYIWCGSFPPENENSEKPKCSFWDETGYAFDDAPYFSGEVYFKFYGASFPKENFDKLITLKNKLETMGLKPSALYKIENGDIKIFLVSRNASSEPEIIFKADSDYQKLAENLELALSTEPLKSNFKNKYSSLEYIDLRFGNKVYFKFR